MKKIFVMFFLIVSIVSGKNIYVVYDDSLSMKKQNRDIYANYAMQTLVSLLSEDDYLTITKMSDIREDFRNKMIVDLTDIPKELEYFQKKLIAQSQVTPYKAVETLGEYIGKNYSKEDTNWLIVITDGEFEDGKPIPDMEKIKDKFSETVQKVNLKPIFLLIGSDKKELDKYENQEGIKIWKEIFGQGEFPKIYKASNQKEILDKMREIAQLLTAKSSKNSEKIYKVEGNKIKFKSLFPLSKIIFLSQVEGEKTLNKLKKIYVDGKEIENKKDFYPKSKERAIILQGNIVHLRGDKNFTNEEIILEFEREVENDTKIFPEVAARFQVDLLNEDGKEIKQNFFKTSQKQEFKVNAKLLTGETDKLLDFIEGTEVVINYGGKKIPLKYDREDKIYKGSIVVEKGKKSIDGTAEFPGYFNYQSDIYVIEGTEEMFSKPKPPVVREPNIEFKTNANENIKIKQSELKNYIFDFSVLKEGEPLIENLHENFRVEVKNSLTGDLKESMNGWQYIFKNERQKPGIHELHFVLINKGSERQYLKKIRLEVERDPYHMGMKIFPETEETILQNKLKEMKIQIIPTVNGKYLTEEEIKNIKINFKSDLGGKLSEYTAIGDNQRYGWEYALKTYSGFSNYKNPQGKKIIEVTLLNEEEEKNLKETKIFNLEKIGFFTAYGKLAGFILSIVAFIILIYGWIKKKKFTKNEKIIIQEKTDEFQKPDQKRALKATFIGVIMPFKDESCVIGDIEFIADKGFVRIIAEKFAKSFNRSSVKKIYINGEFIDKEDLKKGKKEFYRLYNDDSIEIVYDTYSKKYICKDIK